MDKLWRSVDFAVLVQGLQPAVIFLYSGSQNLTFKEQLDAGIRYFDLRVSSKPGEPGNEIYFIHGLFGHKVGRGENIHCHFIDLK